MRVDYEHLFLELFNRKFGEIIGHTRLMERCVNKTLSEIEPAEDCNLALAKTALTIEENSVSVRMIFGTNHSTRETFRGFACSLLEKPDSGLIP
jgi:hypothetical protein